MAAAFRCRFLWHQGTALVRRFQFTRQRSADAVKSTHKWAKWKDSPVDCWMDNVRNCMSYTPWSCNAASSQSCSRCCRRLSPNQTEQTMFSGHEEALSNVKDIIKSSTPGTLSDSSRQNIADIMRQLLCNKSIVTAVLKCCPYYAAMHKEPEMAAEYNQLWVVYTVKDDIFYSSPLEASSARLPASIEYDGWLRVIELKDFLVHVLNGQTNHVETLLAPAECHITHDLDWTVMRHKLTRHSWDLVSYGFLFRALRQMYALALTEEGKVREDATTYEWCTIMRLLGHFDAITLQKPLTVWKQFPYRGLPSDGDVAPETEVQALYALHSGVLDKSVLQDHVIKCFRQYPLTTTTLRKHVCWYTKPNAASLLFQYVMRARLWGYKVKEQPVHEDDAANAESVLAEYKHCLSKVHNMRTSAERQALVAQNFLLELEKEDVLHHCPTGPRLHNLYIDGQDKKAALLLYRFKTARYIAQLHDCHDKGALQALPENDNLPSRLSICDARWFAGELLKGSVDIIELLFSDIEGGVFSSHVFQMLRSRRQDLLTEVLIDSYVAFVENSLSSLEGSPSDEEAGNLLYLAFHKISELKHLLAGQAPQVSCDGELRDYLLQVRQGPYMGAFAIATLKGKAVDQLAELKEKRSRRSVLLPACMPNDLLTQWLTDNVYVIERSEESLEPSQTFDLTKALLSPISSDVIAADEITSALSEADHQGIVDFFDDSVRYWKENVNPYLPK